MSESSLSLNYVDLANAACDELRQGSDYTTVDAPTLAVIDSRVQEGYRQVINPAVLPGEATPHRWSWLIDLRTVTTSAPYSTGYVTVDSGALTVVQLESLITCATSPALTPGETITQGTTSATAKVSTVSSGVYVYSVSGSPDSSHTWTGGTSGATFTPTTVPTATGTFPSWVGTASTGQSQISLAGIAYDVASRNSNTQITLSQAVTAGYHSTYQLSQLWYDLPDDYGAIEGPITYQPHFMWFPIRVVGEGMIRSMKQTYIWLGRPTQACISWKPHVDSTSSGQRARIQFMPQPDQAYLLTFRMKVLVSKLSTTNKYPLGGMEMSTVYEAAVRAVCEKWEKQQQGPRWAEFMEQLTRAITNDRMLAPEHYGRFMPNGMYGDNAFGWDGLLPYSPHLVTYTPGM